MKKIRTLDFHQIPQFFIYFGGLSFSLKCLFGGLAVISGDGLISDTNPQNLISDESLFRSLR